MGLALRKLAEEGVERFVITADHGYLYGEELAESDKIDPPGGKTVLCHRRVWAGQGGAASESYLLTEVSRFGAPSDLEMAVPWNLAGFRTAGPTAYFHGGLSPQEILLPVIVVTPNSSGSGRRALRSSRGKCRWGAPKYYSIPECPHASAFARDCLLSLARCASGGSSRGRGLRNSRERVLWIPGVDGCSGVAVSKRGSSKATEANTVALMLTSKAPSRGTVSIHLVDAATGVELKKLENVEVSLAI